MNGEEHQHHPDFAAALDDAWDELDPLNVVIEVTGDK
jgi:hypothetical protein